MDKYPKKVKSVVWHWDCGAGHRHKDAALAKACIEKRRHRDEWVKRRDPKLLKERNRRIVLAVLSGETIAAAGRAEGLAIASAAQAAFDSYIGKLYSTFRGSIESPHGVNSARDSANQIRLLMKVVDELEKVKVNKIGFLVRELWVPVFGDMKRARRAIDMAGFDVGTVVGEKSTSIVVRKRGAAD